MKKFLPVLAAAAMAMVQGCSFFTPSTQIIAVNIIPQDVKLIANGVEYSGAPLFIEARRSQELLIKVYKRGYLTQTVAVGRQLSDTGTLDACFSFLILPALGLFTPGAWEMDQNNLTIILLPDEKLEASIREKEAEKAKAGTPDTASEKAINTLDPKEVILKVNSLPNSPKPAGVSAPAAAKPAEAKAAVPAAKPAEAKVSAPAAKPAEAKAAVPAAKPAEAKVSAPAAKPAEKPLKAGTPGEVK